MIVPQLTQWPHEVMDIKFPVVIIQAVAMSTKRVPSLQVGNCFEPNFHLTKKQKIRTY